MRWPGATRGVAPSHCQACREEHPDEAWCDFHGAAHPSTSFTPARGTGRRAGRRNICVEAVCILASEQRGMPAITCPACGLEKPSHRFRGGQQKAVACKECEVEHWGFRWCKDCAAWLPDGEFTRTGKRGKFLTVRCRPCRAASAHGVLAADLGERRCAACGDHERLVIDHDHGHCAGPVGCRECVRGFLCHACNTAEGLLRTPGRARALAAYMETHGIR